MLAAWWPERASRTGFAALTALMLALTGGSVRAAELGTIKLGVLQFGTVKWELDVI
jgi:hypothetical protein